MLAVEAAAVLGLHLGLTYGLCHSCFCFQSIYCCCSLDTLRSRTHLGPIVATDNPCGASTTQFPLQSLLSFVYCLDFHFPYYRCLALPHTLWTSLGTPHRWTYRLIPVPVGGTSSNHCLSMTLQNLVSLITHIVAHTLFNSLTVRLDTLLEPQHSLL